MIRCTSPYISNGAALRCGKCEPCLHLTRRIWSHRLMLEGLCHERKCFVTLTYADYGDGRAPTQLFPEHLKLWHKRLRERVAPQRYRHFSIGEYGDRTFRPHYHAVLFGAGPCEVMGEKACQCSFCRLVRETWGYGHIQVSRNLEYAHCGYVTGYVTKKMTHRLDSRLNGREPEFRRMSCGRGEGGIGAPYMKKAAQVFLKYKEHLPGVDVPSTLGHLNGRQYPLGKYLRNRLRQECDVYGDPMAIYEDSKILQALRADAEALGTTVKELFAEVFAPYAASLKSRVARKSLASEAL